MQTKTLRLRNLPVIKNIVNDRNGIQMYVSAGSNLN